MLLRGVPRAAECCASRTVVFSLPPTNQTLKPPPHNAITSPSPSPSSNQSITSNQPKPHIKPTQPKRQSDILDWHGDHPYTNYHETFDALVDAGYSVDVLAAPLTCADLRNYG